MTPTERQKEDYLDQIVAEMEALRAHNDAQTKAAALRIDRAMELARQAKAARNGTDRAPQG